MAKKVLVTGGAGFIGSFLVNELIKRGHHVGILDNLEVQVHGVGGWMPQHLSEEAEFIHGDIRDYDLLKKNIKKVEVIFHLAAMVGVGQSMYEIRKYVEVNSLGSANLLHILVNENKPIEKVIVASSMSCYGEGKYECANCGVIYTSLRGYKQLANREWEMKCPACAQDVKPLPTDEKKPLSPASVYAITKRDQEEMFISLGKAHNIPTVALRYFNVYGPYQSLSNPYTGVMAIFSSRLLNKKPPIIFEDGLQSRDFIHVSDIVQANILAMEKKKANYEVFNVGTGIRTNLLKLLELLKKEFDPKDKIKPEIVNKFREGDIRHCYADITKIKKKLGFKPKIQLENGITSYINWAKEQKAEDLVQKAFIELNEKKLIK